MAAEPAEPIRASEPVSHRRHRRAGDLARAARQGLRRHWPLLIVLAVAGAARAAVAVTYPNAFYFPDSAVYIDIAKEWEPDTGRTFGYSFFLKLFFPRLADLVPFAAGPYQGIAVLQHLMGLGLIVAGYFFLARLGTRPWLAALALAPLALDGRLLTLEHHIASETLFLVLLTGALIMLARQERLTVASAAIAGALTAATGYVRAVGLPIVVLAVAYLALRRVGWRPLLVFTAVAGSLLAAYPVYYHHYHGEYVFEQTSGRALASRASTFADCDRLELTPSQREICPADPRWHHLQRSDAYTAADAPITLHYPKADDDPILREFGATVIRQQFGDYLRIVAEQSAWHFLPSPPVDETGQCVVDSWELPVTPNVRCQARMYLYESGWVPDEALQPVPATRKSTAMAAYSDVVLTPGPLLAVAILIGLVALFWRPSPDNRRLRYTAALFVGVGLALPVMSVATGMYEMRYLMPTLYLAPVGAALAITHFRAARRSDPQASAPTPTRSDEAEGEART